MTTPTAAASREFNPPSAREAGPPHALSGEPTGSPARNGFSAD